MKRYIQYEPFNIYSFEAKEWEHPVHNHSYFELIFIRSGNGKHFINNNEFDYMEGDVFFLGPEDYHYFKIGKQTSFCYLRFTENFIKNTGFKKDKIWVRTIELLLNSPYQSCGSVVKEETEKNQLNHLLAVLLQEYLNREESSYEIITDSIMKTILTILARNIIKQSFFEGAPQKISQPIEDMLLFINQNIYKPENLRIDHIAENFNYSANYLSIFFKKQMGEPLQQYILKYKLKLIENRLRYSNLSISQISYEFGFTDESHFYKTFRKHYGVAPKEYRNQDIKPVHKKL